MSEYDLPELKSQLGKGLDILISALEDQHTLLLLEKRFSFIHEGIPVNSEEQAEELYREKQEYVMSKIREIYGDRE